MPELIFELFSEEIPARMQAKASADLAAAFRKGFAEAKVAHGEIRAFATPRRLALHVADLARATEAAREELKGPRADAPEKALAGFLRKTGLAKDQLELRDDKKGQVYFAVIETPARPADAVISEIAPAIIKGFPWPKSMRWGAGALRWVRPLRAILCVIRDGKETAVAPFSVDGIEAGDVTYGHRFMAADRKSGGLSAKPIKVKSFAQYRKALAEAHVVLDPAEREALILDGARRLTAASGLELVEDPGLVREVAGLVEHPEPLLGAIAPEFQALPPEVLRVSMKEHQKFFSAREPKSGRITGFVTVANIAAPDGGATILAGNERVLRARLADAMFFYQNDLSAPLEAMTKKLKTVVFHNQLGSQADRVARLAPLARALAPLTGADPGEAERAARLAKADLVSEMVYEFPELQGYMGRVYAAEAQEPTSVADAIEGHYAPLGPTDDAPRAPVSAALALADKLDQLAGFWAIGAKPTGSGDPFALRRAALGVIRIVLENGYRLSLDDALAGHVERLAPHLTDGAFDDAARADLLSFLADRMKVSLRDAGARHDVVEAVFGLARAMGRPAADDLTLAKKRIDAVGALLGSADGENLLAAFKRANNILTAEEA
ncbi:MAG: glycine--tRNA ligase subunit beta, partial [Pseudomonadota bacterium]